MRIQEARREHIARCIEGCRRQLAGRNAVSLSHDESLNASAFTPRCVGEWSVRFSRGFADNTSQDDRSRHSKIKPIFGVGSGNFASAGVPPAAPELPPSILPLQANRL